MQVPGKRWMNLMEIIWEVKLKGGVKISGRYVSVL
jgi:hypothetical protein